MPNRVVLIIQARMGSTRLPGKSLMDLAGAPLVGRMLERVKRCNSPDEIVLATTDLARDDGLAVLAERYGVALFRGSEDDLVDRYYQAARAFRADTVLRLPGDNPTPEPEEIDRCVAAHQANDAEFTSNITHFFGNGYPDGIGIEAFGFDVLEDVWRRERNPSRREHVASNFVDYSSDRAVQPHRYRIATIECPADIRRPDITLDVNLAEEYVYFKELYEALHPINPTFGIRDIIRWHDARAAAHQPRT